MFCFRDRIKKDHPIFKEEYFLFMLNSNVYVAKKIEDKNLPESLKFDYVEILNGLKIIRKMKLKKLFN